MDTDIMELIASPEAWIALGTLALLEIVLGIDNIVFITILTGKLPEEQQTSARRIGIGLALISRLGLLFALSWVMGLVEPLFTVFEQSFSGRDLILLLGGLFLVGKAAHEIYESVEHVEGEGEGEGRSEEDLAKKPKGSAYTIIMVQIILLDIVFSLDSVITAVGMAESIVIMVVAMIIAVAVMMIFAGPVGNFVNRHASVKILALAFLVLIGVLLMVEGFGQHVPKGYIYFAMGFAVMIEMINMRRRKKSQRTRLREVSMANTEAADE